MQDFFQGYPRADGRVGTRNHVAIVPTSVEANHVAKRINKMVVGTVGLPHEHGQIQVPEDAARTFRVLEGVGRNPNVGAVLVVGVKQQDTIIPMLLAQRIQESGKPVEVVIVEEHGGSVKAIETGVQRARDLVRKISSYKRQKIGLDKLIVGSKCGGSDTTSGLVTNPALGHAMDLVVEAGGTVIFGETPEIIGAEHILVKRAASPEVAQQLLDAVARWEDAVARMGTDMRGGNPSPGNIAGGLTTIEEKSLGAISKAGYSLLQGVVTYGECPVRRGLYFMDSPGNDIECVSGMLASGVQVVCFTTGRGTPTGSPIAPVIKLCANPTTNQKMRDNIDVELSDALLGQRSLEQSGEDIFNYILSVASGEDVKAEVLGHKEFSINRIAVGR